MFPTIVFRHKKENIKKCSLRGLESRPDFFFFTYSNHPPLDLSNYILLSIDGEEELSDKDKDKGIFLLDATWRYVESMVKHLDIPTKNCRRIPSGYKTAYPRRQDDCSDPERGLSSVEALYVAYKILGRKTDGLLDNYYWKDQFLEVNENNYNEIRRGIGCDARKLS